MRVVIVGGVAGGASTAARLRRLDEQAEIIVLERGEYVSFANCGLPYYIGEVIQERDNLLVVKPELFRDRFNIDVRLKSEAVEINRKQKTVTVLDHTNNNRYQEKYDKLVLSPGATPVRPPLPGINSSRIFTLRNIPDTDAIKQAVDSGRVRRAVVVGGGFIGLEMVENLSERGVQVSLVELAPQVMAPLDFEMAAIIHQHLMIKNIQFFLKDGVKAFHEDKDGITTELESGRTIPAEIVILAIGVKPETSLAQDAGLKTGRGIIVNARMQTSDKDIYAVGDAVEVEDFISGGRTLIPLAWPANKQGRIAADNIAGRKSSYAGSQGTAIAKVFDLTVASTGNNEKQLKARAIPYQVCFTHSVHHAGYYPGAVPMSIKLLYDPNSGKVLGAQIVGVQGVDKRIDVLATAVRAGMSVYDLESLELAYAPPYSSAKDPVVMAGFVAANSLRGDVENVQWHEVDALLKKGALLLDVRMAEEFSLGTIPGAVNIPIDELRDRLGELPKKKTLLVFCQIGLRGYVVCRMLTQLGYTAVNLSGGYKTYHFTTLKQTNEDVYAGDKVELSDHIVAAGGRDPDQVPDARVDACGLQCPGPVLKMFERLSGMQSGQMLEVQATDPGFATDVKAWCERTGNPLLALNQDKGVFSARIRKGMPRDTERPAAARNAVQDKTIVLFSGDFDKAMAAFIIANTAASMGRKVTIFFTFWGLNLLRQGKRVRVKKTLIERMFGWMMPRGADKFKLSKMHMLGMGTGMIKAIMRKKQVAPLPELIATALRNGVRLVACQMTMELMGIKVEELIQGVETGGAASYLSAAEISNVNLFI